MDEGFGRLRAIIEQAMDLPAEERRTYVEAECCDDEALREEAVALLDGLRDDTFLSPAPSLRTRGPALDPTAGTVLGGYRLVRVLGSGGMGTVYEAEQAAPRRSVALKVLDRSVRSSAARERFRYEVEVLGALRHRGIAQIYEAGIESGEEGATPLPWFAMELVAGASTVRSFADRNGLSETQRLRLFLDVLAAVQHGHQKGVIHRDLKPDNILVDRRERVKIIDFGVARVADPKILTATLRAQAEEIVGTVAYMSPEQVSGKDVDTRSDVYALGVVLYELLTGELPIDVRKTDFITSARRIVEEPPRRPRTLRSGIPPDLEAVLLKALEKGPAERYESAGALADDLRRFLGGEAVEARSGGALHQLRLFARRNKALVSAVAAVLVVTSAAAAVSLDFAFRSKEAEQAATKERARFEQLYRTQFMQNVESVAVDARLIGDLYGGAPVALRMTRAAIGRLEALQETSAEDVEFQLELADAYRRLVLTLSDLAHSEKDAGPAITRAGARALSLVDGALRERGDDPAAHARRVAVLTTLAQVARGLGQDKESQEFIADALAGLDAAGSPPGLAAFTHFVAGQVAYQAKQYEETLAHVAVQMKAMERTPKPDAVPGEGLDFSNDRVNLAGAYHLRAEAQRGLRRFEQAAADLARCIAILEELAAAQPERLTHRIELASAMVAMGYVNMALNRRKEIESWYGRAHEELERLYHEAPRNLAVAREYALAIRGLGQIENSRAIQDHPKGSPGRIAGLRRALAHYDRATALLREVLAQRPDSAWVRDAIGLLEKMSGFTRRVVEGDGGGDPVHGK